MSALVVAWLACGTVDAGYCYAFLQRRYPSIADGGRMFDAVYAVGNGIFGGPCALIASVMTGAIKDNDPWIWFRYGWLIPGARP